jgi:hypothetical protein
VHRAVDQNVPNCDVDAIVVTVVVGRLSAKNQCLVGHAKFADVFIPSTIPNTVHPMFIMILISYHQINIYFHFVSFQDISN